jgi:hypothetical protein
LHPRASALQKWLPILSREETLTFRAAPPILHIQRLPRREESQQQIILFVRDPRDALHSLYRRTQPELSWNEYIHWPQAETLLGAIDYWRLFIECWSDFRSVFIGRFEDYKANATTLLKQILDVLQVTCSPGEIARAVENSSYAAAAEAEKRYRESHPHDRQVANRGGKVGEWETLDDLQPTFVDIEHRANHLLQRLGYRVTTSSEAADDWSCLAITRTLPSFTDAAVPAYCAEGATHPPDESQIARLRTAIQTLSLEKLHRAKLETHEAQTLLRNLEIFSHKHAPDLASSLGSLTDSLNDGSAFHLSRIRSLLLSRRSESST